MTWWWAVAAGVVLGVIYTLSPLAVLSLGALTWAICAAGRGLSEGETRWFWCLITAAVALRLAAIAALVVTADPSQPFASFFGDEVLYKSRTVWLRNLGQGIPMSPADVIYGVDAVGLTAYTYVLALLQAVVGDAPYGLHVMNMTLYLAAVLALYRLVRASYGTAVSLAGLIALLFLPSLISWSISVLKEPITVFMLAGELMCALAIVRAPHYWQKALAAAGVALFAIAMENLRAGGLLTAALGTVGGISLSFALARGRRLAGVLVAAPIAIAIVASSAAVQERVVANLRHAASYHAGHVQTPGYTYRLLELRYYRDRNYIFNQLPPREAGRFAVEGRLELLRAAVPVAGAVAGLACVSSRADRVVRDGASLAAWHLRWNATRPGAHVDARDARGRRRGDRRAIEREYRHADQASIAGVSVSGLAVGAGRARAHSSGR